MDGAVTSELFYWDPSTGAERSEPVKDIRDALGSIERVASQYEKKDAGIPGIEIRAPKHGQLAIAIAPFGWALVQSDENFDQHCTETTDSATDGASLDVIWDQPTSVPRRWFVTKEEARRGIEQWLEDGTLSPSLKWSDKCF
jgi:hypothetical protein